MSLIMPVTRIDAPTRLPELFQVGQTYTRAEVQNLLGVPEPRRGGNWDTGYTKYRDQFFIFCNIGTPGRTGHDYANHWDGSCLAWEAKSGSRLDQPQIEDLVSKRYPIHIFYRDADRQPFTYAGLGTPGIVVDSSPVQVRWRFDEGWRQALSADAIAAELAREGFNVEPPKVKTQRTSSGELVIYLKRESNSHVLVIDPRWETELADLTAIPGVRRPLTRFFYHNSTMRSFPKRRHTGSDEIPFGIDFDFETLESIRAFIVRLRGSKMPPNEIAAAESGGSAEVDPQTETETVRAARLGQQKFRNDLLERWRGRCALTSLAMPELLRASHIKPWSNCTNKERLDPDNGLLLAVHIDGLFDRGFISFEETGAVMISPKLSDEARRTFGLVEPLRIAGLTERNLHYLATHRAFHFPSPSK
ncbi:HNH endonuclease [Microvirga sp. RSM25]|uniref:HNH endonuclease n=1 Tax=Microvirga sp. RSM25 TaxID=3273802 RepID=UPI00384E55E2